MTNFPGYLKYYPNMHAAFPFHIHLNRLSNGYQAHRHDFLEFSYIIEGTGAEVINGVHHPMRPGTFTYILPYQVHEIHTDPGSTLVLYNCNFSMDLLFETGVSDGFGGLLSGGGELPSHAVFEGEEALVMKQRLSDMLAEYKANQKWRDQLLKAKLIETLIQFDRLRTRTTHAAPLQTSDLKTAAAAPVSSGSTTKSSVWTIIHYIHNNYQEELSLTDLARRFSLSASRMSEVIKEATGQTFVHFVHDLRLREASSLLVSTDMSVTDIAHEVGFGSYKTFARMFKEAKHVAPTEYRKRKRSAAGASQN